MKNFLLTILVLCYSITYSQNDIPAGYATAAINVGTNNHVYFNFKNALSSVKNQSGWDIALYNEYHEIGGKINDASGVRVWRVYKDSVDFNSVTLADTLFPITNNDSFMYLGALDTIYTGSFDLYFRIGLGKYYTGSYNAYGDKIYIIKREDGSFGKFFFISYDKSNNRKFSFKYANIDNTGVKYVSVDKQLAPQTYHYQYLNLSTGLSATNYESDNYKNWDLVFKPFDKIVSNSYTRTKMGVFTNNSFNLIRFSNVQGLPNGYLENPITHTEGYEASGVPSSVVYNNSLDGIPYLTRNNNQIGEKWFDNTSLNCKKNVSYYVKTMDGCIYHIVFTSYDNTTNAVNIAYKLVKCVSNAIEIPSSNTIEIITSQDQEYLYIKNNSVKDKMKSIDIYNMVGVKIFENLDLNSNEIKIEKSRLNSSLLILNINTASKTMYSKVNLF